MAPVDGKVQVEPSTSIDPVPAYGCCELEITRRTLTVVPFGIEDEASGGIVFGIDAAGDCYDLIEATRCRLRKICERNVPATWFSVLWSAPRSSTPAGGTVLEMTLD